MDDTHPHCTRKIDHPMISDARNKDCSVSAHVSAPLRRIAEYIPCTPYQYALPLQKIEAKTKNRFV